MGCGASDLPGSTTTVEATTNLAIDDEIGSICATKADGRHRCWDPQGAPVATTGLPDADYVRVQLAREGAVGLTRDGRMHAVWVSVPPELPPIASFRATNLWGYQGMCLRGTSGELVFGSNRAEVNPDTTLSSPWHYDAGPYASVTCAFEGLVCSVRPDGTVSGNCPTATPGNDWKQATISVHMSCGLTTSDEIRCARGFIGTDERFPVFAPGPYRQLAATYDTACALRADGELTCQRYDSLSIPAPPGPFVSIEAGGDLLCGIRPDGTSSCFRENGTTLSTSPHGDAFVPLSPAIDADW